MKTAVVIAFILIIACSSFGQQQGIDGDWAGGSALFQPAAFVHVRFAGTGGVANVQAWRMFNRQVNGVSLTGAEVHFEIPSTAGEPYVADGELKGNVIEGTMRRGETVGKFHLVRLAKVKRELYDKYIGAYSFPDPKQPGQFQPVLVTYGALGHLRYVNLATGDTTALFPVSDTTFFMAGAVVAAATPEALAWSFENDARGNLTSVVRIAGQPEQRGTRNDTYKQERVTIPSGGATLAATLVMPGGKGKHPAVVFVPGSNALSRDESAPFREFDAFIRARIAILVYDKRGVGESTGKWEEQSFGELADDALAAVKFLKGRPEIDAKKIGVWGFSQGGSIAPLAASRSKDIAFVIIASGAGVTNEEAELNDQLARMRRQNLTEEEIKDATAFIRLQFQAAYSAEGRQKFRAAIPGAEGKRWYARTWGRIPESDWWWKWWGMNGQFDSATVLEKVKVPVLAVFGAADELTLPEVIPQMAARIEAALKKGGNNDVTTKIFAGANHDLSVKLENGQWAAPPGYHDLLTKWILEKVNK